MLVLFLSVMICAIFQRTGDPDAELTKEEIQSAIDKANAQTAECKECKFN